MFPFKVCIIAAVLRSTACHIPGQHHHHHMMHAFHGPMSGHHHAVMLDHNNNNNNNHSPMILMNNQYNDHEHGHHPHLIPSSPPPPNHHHHVHTVSHNLPGQSSVAIQRYYVAPPRSASFHLLPQASATAPVIVQAPRRARVLAQSVPSPVNTRLVQVVPRKHLHPQAQIFARGTPQQLQVQNAPLVHQVAHVNRSPAPPQQQHPQQLQQHHQVQQHAQQQHPQHQQLREHPQQLPQHPQHQQPQQHQHPQQLQQHPQHQQFQQHQNQQQRVQQPPFVTNPIHQVQHSPRSPPPQQQHTQHQPSAAISPGPFVDPTAGSTSNDPDKKFHPFDPRFSVAREEASDEEWKAEIQDSFASSGLIPEVLPKAPDGLVNINFGTHNCVHMGTLLEAETSAYEPTAVSYPTADDDDKAGLYCLIMMDVDAVRTGRRLHWMVVNIPGAKVADGDVIAEYDAPAPPPGSKPHRFVFVAYQQTRGRIDPGRLRAFVTKACQNRGRTRFDLDRFKKAFDLKEEAAAANYFTVEHDDFAKSIAEFCEDKRN